MNLASVGSSGSLIIVALPPVSCGTSTFAAFSACCALALTRIILFLWFVSGAYCLVRSARKTERAAGEGKRDRADAR
jgi:hypothetical protein